MQNIIAVLEERGFIENKTHEQELHDYVNNASITCYIGFDPSASSLHVGSLIPIMALAHLQRHGHRPIALVGGGTGLVGDPSGKTEMRKLLTAEDVEKNALGIKKQLSRFIDFKEHKAFLLNNAQWLTRIEYIPFLRDIGRHFSVNRMLKAESYMTRLNSDEGLNFIEFNYMLLQAYDFLELANNYACRLQLGGSDQWGNIVAGIDLIRKVRRETAFGITFPLITTSSGAKMGKTAQGAVWLDPERFSPYEYYQFWVNTDDQSVQKFLALFTFLPMSEIKTISELSGAELNGAKSILAFEATQLAHGQTEAQQAFQSAASMFGAKTIASDLLPSSTIPRGLSEIKAEQIPTTDIDEAHIKVGIPVFKLFVMTGLANSGSHARRLIQQGGAYLNDQRVPTYDALITLKDCENGSILLRAGKKRYHRIKVI